MTISDFKDWLKTKVDCPNWFTGGLRSIDQKSIVVYNGKAFINPMAIGGIQNSSYKGKGIRILVHWNKNIKESELKAQEIYNFINGLANIKIANKRVIQFRMRDTEPIYLGVDDSGIFEYVIDLEIIHER
ncbi:phage tail terminator protein [Tissierella praeacuta]|uniref:phage tail terminator protein n=1 Tax=Tissierella praeacuta TaxID=43131 RepID=UPI0028A6442A|nr:minor capsid protein [Tissierella praeacuta]